MSATEQKLAAEIERLRNVLAGISLVSQRNDSPAHVLLQQVGREARAAVCGSAAALRLGIMNRADI